MFFLVALPSLANFPQVICTLGPCCWSEEGLASLIAAGMSVARFNFSHGTHEAHQEVLDRLRKVRCAAQKKHFFLLGVPLVTLTSWCGML